MANLWHDDLPFNEKNLIHPYAARVRVVKQRSDIAVGEEKQKRQEKGFLTSLEMTTRRVSPCFVLETRKRLSRSLAKNCPDYPLMTPTGRNRATRFDTPARSMVSTTSATSL